MSLPTDARPSFARLLVPVWLVTAAWDFVCASALSVFAYHTPVARLWRGVAATALGPSALEGGARAIAAGIALHLAVAFTWSLLFVLALRAWPALRETIATPGGALVVAAVYGPIIWLVMSLVVIQIATGRTPRFGVRWWVQVFAHVPFVTIPLVFTARHMLRARCRMAAAVLTLTALAAVASPAEAQTGWQPSAGHVQIPIWPGTPPDARPMQGPEVAGTVIDTAGRPKLVGGKPWVYVDRVSQPTMTIYAAEGSNTGITVVVFPGGGYNVLAIDLEGTEVCDWLTPKGITCVVLKYRVPCVKTGPYRDCRTALQDAQRAVGLLRSRAAQYGIDPHRIGVLGFSAGGHMVAAISTHSAKRLYAPVDAADTVSCRPDFAIALYPGHLAVPERNFVLNPDIRVTARTPPTFLLQAEDDPVDPVENSLVYYRALRKAGIPAEMHVYVKGGHAFALRRTSAPITEWPPLVERWLESIGILAR